MDKEKIIDALQKEWKKILIDKDMSETQFFKEIGISQQAGNRKIAQGTIKYYDLVMWLNHLGYTLTITKVK